LQLTKISRFKLKKRNLKNLGRNISSICILAGAALCLLLVGANGWLSYRGENLQEYRYSVKLGVAIVWNPYSLGVCAPKLFYERFYQNPEAQI